MGKFTVKSYTLNSVVLVPQGTINLLPANASDYTKITTDYIGNMIIPERYYETDTDSGRLHSGNTNGVLLLHQGSPRQCKGCD